MKLEFDNCQVLIEDNHIDCNYEFVMGRQVHWTLQFDQNLIFKDGSQTKLFEISKIKEFIFEIDQGIQRAHNFSQIAKSYVIFYDTSEPIALFELCVRQELKQSKDSKSYEFAEEIIKRLSKRYNKPYSYKLCVETKKKSKKRWLSFLYVLIAIAMGVLLSYLIN
jgi:capsule polysaccharide export protein KpsC/LpsZ